MTARLKTSSNSQGILVALATLALLLVLLSGFLSYRHALDLVDSGRWVAQSHEILATLKSIDSQVQDTQAFQRGFVIMHVDLLYPYRQALDQLNLEIRRLAKLTDQDSQHHTRVEQLNGLMKSQLEFAERVIMARTSDRINEALEEIEEGRGNQFLDKMKTIVDEMRSREDGLLRARTNELNENSSQMIVTIVFLGVVALSSFIMLLLAAHLYLVERKRIENLTTTQYEIARCLAESRDLKPTITDVIHMVCNRLQWDAGEFWTLDDNQQTLVCQSFWSGHSGPILPLLEQRCAQSERLGSGLVGEIAAAGRSRWFRDLSIEKESDQEETPVLKSAFLSPVRIRGTVCGVFQFSCREPREPDSRLVEMFDTICLQIGEFIHRKRSEWELVLSQVRLNAVLTNMAEAMILADLNQRIILANNAAERMFGEGLAGATLEEFLARSGTHDRSMVELSDVELLPLSRAIKAQSVDEEEFLIQNDIQEQGLWVSATARPVRTEAGELLGGVMVLRDISERKEAERRVSEFYSMVSHELRTPLTSIRASLGLMHGGVAGHLPEMAVELIEIGREECDRLIRLINNILDIRKIEAGKFELSRNEVDVKDLVRSAIEGLRPFADANHVGLTTDRLPDATIICDADRIIQVITNLISNAVKFSPDGSTVTVSAAVSNGTVEFFVEDEGVGIPSERMKKLFSKFQQLDQSDTRKIGGTGLGLAISKAIVEQHGGRIEVTSDPGRGSTFHFQIPVHPPDMEDI